MANEDKVAALKEFRKIMDGMDDFQLLGVTAASDDSAVRSAYFSMLKKFGADFFHGVDGETMEAVNAVNQRLRDAYRNLQTAEKRREALEAMEKARKESEEPSGSGGASPNANVQVDIAAVFEAEQAMTRARNLMERGSYELALKHLNNALSKDPNNLETEARIAYSEFMVASPDAQGRRPVGLVGKARRLLERAVSEWPANVEMSLYRADVEKLEGNVDKALEYYREMYKVHKSPIAQREIMLIESRKKQEEEKQKAPQSFLDRIKAQFADLLKKK